MKDISCLENGHNTQHFYATFQRHSTTYASKAFLGYYLPLFKSKTSKDIGVEGRVMGSITLGLLSLNRERDGNDDCSGKGCEEFHFVGDPCVVV